MVCAPIRIFISRMAICTSRTSPGSSYRPSPLDFPFRLRCVIVPYARRLIIGVRAREHAKNHGGNYRGGVLVCTLNDRRGRTCASRPAEASSPQDKHPFFTFDVLSPIPAPILDGESLLRDRGELLEKHARARAETKSGTVCPR